MSGERRYVPADLPAPPQPRREGVVPFEDGRAIGWAEYGDPDGRAVLWFHGTPGGRRQVPPGIDEEAAARGLRVVAVERPGSGLSTPHHHRRVADWVDDVRHVADHLGIDAFSCCGLSGGGPYVLACLALLPDRATAGAVLGGIGPVKGDEASRGIPWVLGPLEPFLRLAAGPLGELATVAVRATRSFAVPSLRAFARVSGKAEREALLRPEMTSLFINDLCTTAEGGLRAPLWDLVLFGRDWGFSSATITQPICFWHGDADGIVPLSHTQDIAGRIPHAKVVVDPGGSHFSGFLRPAEVLDWLAERG